MKPSKIIKAKRDELIQKRMSRVHPTVQYTVKKEAEREPEFWIKAILDYLDVLAEGGLIPEVDVNAMIGEEK